MNHATASRLRLLFAMVLSLVGFGSLGPVSSLAVEQGTITVSKSWAAGDEPAEVIEVCFIVTEDMDGLVELGDACTTDDTYSVTFGPTDPDLQTGVTYYVWEDVGPGWAVTDGNPVEVVIPDTTGEAVVSFENRRADGMSTVTIHKALCPEGTSDLYGECHDTRAPDIHFSINGTRVVTDGDGVASADVASGTIEIVEADTDFSRESTAGAAWVFCSVQPGGDVLFDGLADHRTISITVADGETAVCDWYNLTTDGVQPGTLELHKRVCPSGDVTDLYAECHDFAPQQEVSFSLNGGSAQSVDGAGNVTFTPVDAGTQDVSIVEGIPLEFVSLKIFCSTLGSDAPAIEVVPDGPNFQVAVGAGDHVICDVYNIPENLSGLTPTPVDSGTASLEIHKRVCPGGGIENLYDECHDNAPEQEISFSINGGAPRSVDASGNVIFEGLNAGDQAVQEVEGIPLEFVRLSIWCSVADGDSGAFQVIPDGPNFIVTLGAGERLICDVYNIPEDLSGFTPTATNTLAALATVTSTAVPPTATAVPVVGRPAHVHAGTCGDLDRSPRYNLTDLTLPPDFVAGVGLPAVGEASFTVINISLNDLLDGEFAINAHASHDDMDIFVACGDIGGPRRADGTVIIGLREQNNSGLTGIAFLSADPSNANRTQVSLFLTNGLAEEDPSLQVLDDETVAIRSAVNNGPVSPEYQSGYEILISGNGDVEIIITPPGASDSLDEADRTADQEITTSSLDRDEMNQLLADLDAIGYFQLPDPDSVDPDQLLVGGGVQVVTITLVDGVWEVNANGLLDDQADILEQAQQIIADAVGGVELPDE